MPCAPGLLLLSPHPGACREVAAERAQGVEGLLWRHKELSSDPSACAQVVLVLCDSKHSSGGRDWCILGTHWPARLPDRISSMFSIVKVKGTLGDS